ncbi:hypothetical protein M3Y96_00301200 [Aphelenchoides besseyi]|nr:hypothetical protein M3Y96_00301200 [Aphelenchoides besseyi]
MRSQLLMLLLSLLFLSINGDKPQVGCRDVQIEGMKGLSSTYAQFQLKLDSEFVTPTDDQNSFVFDDSTNQFYKLTYGPVDRQIQSKPATQNTDRLKFIIAKAQDDEVKNVFKGNFLIKNFDVSSPVQFQNAFCVVSESFLDCTCCEDYQRANVKNTPQCLLNFHDDCAIDDLLMAGCKVELSADTQKVSLNAAKESQGRNKYTTMKRSDWLDPGNAIVFLEIQKYKIKKLDECMDNSSPAQIQYICLCPHGQPMISKCQTNVFSCTRVPNLNPQAAVDGQYYKAAAFYLKGSIPSNIQDQYHYMSASRNGITYKLMLKTTTGYSTYPKRGGVLDVVIKYSETQQRSTNTIKTNFNLEKNVVTFQPTFCVQKTNDEMVCVCCNASSNDEFCTTIPAVDMHFHGVASSLGHVRATARSWVSEYKNTQKMNLYINQMGPSFPDITPTAYYMFGDAEPPVEKTKYA